MKQLAITLALLFLLAGTASAQPHHYWYGIMNLSADEANNICEVWNPGGFYPFEMWVWCWSSPLYGMICSEFAICYPPNVIQSTVTWNDPIISVMLGDLPGGLSVCYLFCQWDIIWVCHQTLYLTDTVPTFIEICPHPDVGVVQFANCEPGYPTNVIGALNHLALNQTCMIATEESSWGAIKSMLSE